MSAITAATILLRSSTPAIPFSPFPACLAVDRAQRPDWDFAHTKIHRNHDCMPGLGEIPVIAFSGSLNPTVS